ncbi:MAG: hypothetical protein GF333_00545, partial [Candidatus Omnitrophica bacterium]|nr:hypothetical protein [Candidatus Omnitrophota bacterium]
MNKKTNSVRRYAGIALWVIAAGVIPRAGAERIEFKSGEVLEAPIVERSQEAIRVEIKGLPVSYPLSMVKAI